MHLSWRAATEIAAVLCGVVVLGAIAYLGRGDSLAVQNANWQLSGFHLTGQLPVGTISGRKTTPQRVAISPDGSLASAVVSANRWTGKDWNLEVRLYRPASAELIRRIPAAQDFDFPWGLAYSSGLKAFAGGTMKGELLAFGENDRGARRLMTIGPDTVSSLSFRDPFRAIAVDEKKKTHFIDLQSVPHVQSTHPSSSRFDFCFTDTETTLAAAANQVGELQIWNSEARHLIRETSAPVAINGVVVMKDQTRVVCAAIHTEKLLVYDAPFQGPPREIPLNTRQIPEFAAQPNGFDIVYGLGELPGNAVAVLGTSGLFAVDVIDGRILGYISPVSEEHSLSEGRLFHTSEQTGAVVLATRKHIAFFDFIHAGSMQQH